MASIPHSSKKNQHPFAQPFSRRRIETMTDSERRGPVKPAKVHVRRSFTPYGQARTVCGLYLDIEDRENPLIASAWSEVTCESCRTITKNDEGRMVSSADYVALQNADRNTSTPRPKPAKENQPLCYCDECGARGPANIFTDGLCSDCCSGAEVERIGG